MPASVSSPVARIAAHRVSAGDRAPEPPAGLWASLAALPDPRDRRGRWHALAALLTVAVCAVLAGARSFTAIGEWAADAPPEILAACGIRADPWTGVVRAPDEATMRRVLTMIDGDALDTAIATWLAGTRTPPRAPAGSTGAAVPRQAIAVDGKTLRGSGPPGAQVHLLAAIDHATGTVLGQVAVDGKSNEITAFGPLLAGLDLTRTIVTADAMHTQREHAGFLATDKDAAYIFIVKRNQPHLYRHLQALPWRKVPVVDETHDRGHGRYEIRRLQALSSDRIPFPHALQAIRLTRRVCHQKTGTWTTVTVYAITNLAAHQAGPTVLNQAIRGHWGIEAHHHIRDVTYAEDASQIRTGNAPRTMASLRNLAITILHHTGHDNIAAALRHNARNAARPLTLLGIT